MSQKLQQSRRPVENVVIMTKKAYSGEKRKQILNGAMVEKVIAN